MPMSRNCLIPVLFIINFSYTKLPDDPAVRWREEIVSETILQVRIFYYDDICDVIPLTYVARLNTIFQILEDVQ